MDNGACSYRRFLDGDDEGFVEILRDYKDGLILYLCGVTQNLHTAEEIAEETFFKLITKRPRYNGKAQFKTWLYTIGRNTLRDWYRKNARNAKISVEDCYGLLREGEELEASYIREEQKIALYKKMEKLNPDYRQVLWLLYIEEFSIKESAKIMGRTPHAIECMRTRAKIALKEIYEREGATYEEL